MRNSIFLFALFFVSFSFSQEKYLTKTGTVIFEASVPSFEEVKAKNETTTAILNTKNGNFAALVLVKGFRFKNALMEEHFNENYAESDEFPKATFKGEIYNFSVDNINEEELIYSGSLTFHGKTKVLSNEVLKMVLNQDGTISMTGSLKVDVSDFDIKIPKVVSNKLSEKVLIAYSFILKKK